MENRNLILHLKVIQNGYFLCAVLISTPNLLQSKVKFMSHNYYLNIQGLNTFNIFDGFILYKKLVI